MGKRCILRSRTDNLYGRAVGPFEYIVFDRTQDQLSQSDTFPAWKAYQLAAWHTTSRRIVEAVVVG